MLIRNWTNQFSCNWFYSVLSAFIHIIHLYWSILFMIKLWQFNRKIYWNKIIEILIQRLNAISADIYNSRWFFFSEFSLKVCHWLLKLVCNAYRVRRKFKLSWKLQTIWQFGRITVRNFFFFHLKCNEFCLP